MVGLKTGRRRRSSFFTNEVLTNLGDNDKGDAPEDTAEAEAPDNQKEEPDQTN